MKISLLSSIFLLLASLMPVLAQTDTEEKIPMGFRSSQEYELLTSDQTSELRLLLMLNDDISEEYFNKSKKVLNDFFEEVKSEGLDRFSEAKQIKKLHARIHDRFLVKYEEISPFHEILESGTYNCVSATALFVLTLEELDISYAIQELPTHVYVIAYPGTKNISVEMTSPKDGSYMPSRKDISKAVNTLLDFKLISQEELSSKGERAVYNDFFYRDQTITLKQLASLQFYNEAIVQHNNKEKDAAYNAIKKANLLYGDDSFKSTFFQDEILVDLLEDASFSNMQEVKYLIDYANGDNSNVDKVVYEYGYQVIQKQLIESGRKKFVDSTFNYISDHLVDSTALKRVSEVYYIGLSDYYASAYNLTKQVEYAELAYDLNPDNVKTRSWLAKSILRNLISKDYDDVELIEEIEKEMEDKPFLRTHNYFQMYYFYACSGASNDYYFDNEEELGKKYFDIAEKVLQSMEDPDVLDPYDVGMLYAEPGAYFIRHKDYEKALELLNKGLKLAPDHERIIARMEIAHDRLGNPEWEVEEEDEIEIDGTLFYEEVEEE